MYPYQDILTQYVCLVCYALVRIFMLYNLFKSLKIVFYGKQSRLHDLKTKSGIRIATVFDLSHSAHVARL